jgi:hypothetical protein
MKIKIIYMPSKNIYTLKFQSEDIEGKDIRMLFDFILNNMELLTINKCYVKNGNIYSRDLTGIREVRDSLNGQIMFLKLQGEL